ncbi:MAG TPA: molybdenum cofactor guanylyltransferase MobA [Burkholderiaceae bacterium]|nr:molybdenum cofactor guanylyltransferase MobA [Burkholderiaceae bacterium]
MKDITGLILAGGRGERMGGVDKGWAIHESRPLIMSVVERFAPQVGHLLISANRNIKRYGVLGTVVEDVAIVGESFAGPLIGVLSGLRQARTEWVAIVPCDAPRLPLDLVQRLASAVLHAGAIAASARVNDQLQSTFTLVKTDSAPELASAIAAGTRAMHRWLESIGVVAVDFDDATAFANINHTVTE